MTQNRSAAPDRIGRRTFLVGSAIGVLAACGSDNTANNAASDPTPADASAPPATAGSTIEAGEWALIQRYPANIPVLVPGEVRLPFSLNRNAEFVIDGPETLGAQIVDIDGQPIGERITAVRRDVTPAPYYAFRTSIDAPGVYGIVVDGGPSTGANFQVFAPDEVTIPIPGDTLAGLDTPTVDDPAEVDPVCTRQPVCEFHEVTLTEALDSGKPVAYFIGTPAFCTTGSCTPALEALVDLQPDFDDIVFVHAEVYTDLTATETTQAVQQLSLLFEPTVFLVGSDNTIVERIDGLWDPTEIGERLNALAR